MTDIVLQMSDDYRFRIVSFPSVVRGCGNIFAGQNGFLIRSSWEPDLSPNGIYVYGIDVGADRKLIYVYNFSQFINAVETLQEYAEVLGINFKIIYGGFK